MGIARNSRKADLAGMGTMSPFRSHAEDVRITEAERMIAKRLVEIDALKALLSTNLPIARRRLAQQRLTATQNSLVAWFAYLDEGAEREPRAVAKVTRH